LAEVDERDGDIPCVGFRDGGVTRTVAFCLAAMYAGPLDGRPIRPQQDHQQRRALARRVYVGLEDAGKRSRFCVLVFDLSVKRGATDVRLPASFGDAMQERLDAVAVCDPFGLAC
jgi:hypothetical protein